MAVKVNTFKRSRLFKIEADGSTTSPFVLDVDSNVQSGRDFLNTVQIVDVNGAPKAFASKNYVISGANAGKLYIAWTPANGDVITVSGTLYNEN